MDIGFRDVWIRLSYLGKIACDDDVIHLWSITSSDFSALKHFVFGILRK